MVQTRRQSRRVLVDQTELDDSPIKESTVKSHIKATLTKLISGNQKEASKSTLKSPSKAQINNTPSHIIPIPNTTPNLHQVKSVSKLSQAQPSNKIVVELTKEMPVSPSPKRIDVMNKSPSIYSFMFSNCNTKFDDETKRLMEKTRAEASIIKSKMIAEKNQNNNEGTRKIAIPRGKSGRFSDVHKQAFKKMDSIASHPSMARNNSKSDLTDSADTGFKLATPSNIHSINKLKRSPSKAGLDSPASPSVRSVQQRKPASSNDEHEPPAKRIMLVGKKENSPSKPVRINSTIGRAQTSKLFSPTKSSVARSNSVTSTKIPSPIRSPTRSPTRSPIRRPLSSYGVRSSAPSPASIFGPIASPCKEFTIDEGVKSPNRTLYLTITSDKTLPNHIEKDCQRTPLTNRVSSANIIVSPIKSILRQPQRLYSDDPIKIAAGTHMPTPPTSSNESHATPSTNKRVLFSASTTERADRDEALAQTHSGSSIYPDLSDHLSSKTDNNTSAKPILQEKVDIHSIPPKNFTAISPTIRKVRSSDVINNVETSTISKNMTIKTTAKRKAICMSEDSSTEIDDKDLGKENVEPIRPKKRVKTVMNDFQAIKNENKNREQPLQETNANKVTKKTSTMIKKKSTLLGPRTPKRTGGISAERLAYLSQPKKRV